MPAKPHPRIPSLRHHKATGQGYVVLKKHHIYLGRYDHPDTQQKYLQTIAEWTANGRELPVDPYEITVAEVIAAYWRHTQRYYVGRDGKPTGEADTIRLALKPLKDLYGETRAADFGPLALKAVRQRMIERGWGRKSINCQVGRVKRCFRWAVENEMIPPTVYHGLQAVAGLKQGRSEAHEPDPVKPVPETDIYAVLPLVSPEVRAMIELQLLTGARSGEIVRLRAIDIDTSGKVWLARLLHHKNAYRGRERVLYLGPRAQQIIRAFVADRPLDAYLFSPQDAEDHRLKLRHEARKTPLGYGNSPGTNRVDEPARKAGDCYTTTSYRRAVARACKKAKITEWSPHRLRHNAATIVRREYGLEAAQLILGHAHADVTQIYAETNHAKALQVAERIG